MMSNWPKSWTFRSIRGFVEWSRWVGWLPDPPSAAGDCGNPHQSLACRPRHFPSAMEEYTRQPKFGTNTFQHHISSRTFLCLSCRLNLYHWPFSGCRQSLWLSFTWHGVSVHRRRSGEDFTWSAYAFVNLWALRIAIPQTSESFIQVTTHIGFSKLK